MLLKLFNYKTTTTTKTTQPEAIGHLMNVALWFACLLIFAFVLLGFIRRAPSCRAPEFWFLLTHEPGSEHTWWDSSVGLFPCLFPALGSWWSGALGRIEKKLSRKGIVTITSIFSFFKWGFTKGTVSFLSEERSKVRFLFSNWERLESYQACGKLQGENQIILVWRVKCSW